MKPSEVALTKFKKIKNLLLVDLTKLQELGLAGAPFLFTTPFDCADKAKIALFVIGELKGEWKLFAKAKLKPAHSKNTAVGFCSLNEDAQTLFLQVVSGKAKPKVIEKLLSKGSSKILPPVITKIVFGELPKPVPSEPVVELPKPVEFKAIVVAVNNYKALKTDQAQQHVAELRKLRGLIVQWQEANLPTGGDPQKEKRYASLQKLMPQLNSRLIRMQIETRPEAEPIDDIKEAWSIYVERPVVKGLGALNDLEDRNDELHQLWQKITEWTKRNPAPYSKKEQPVRDELDRISAKVKAEMDRLAAELPKARITHVKILLNTITSASPEEKEKLKTDASFLHELARTVPTAQINDARKLLGLDPVPEERGDEGPVVGGKLSEVWKDPEVQELFKDFAKFTTFEVAVDHRNNPDIPKHMFKMIALVRGTQFWKEGDRGNLKSLTSDTIFELISEDKNNNMRLKNGEIYYYAVRNENVIECDFKVLPATTKLFPEPPSKTHVQQGGLGDCYLLAAAASLAAKDPKAIEDMMLDKGDTVTVRLFDVQIDADTGDKKFTAKYINVDKSIPALVYMDLMAKHHLWVQMLEKAYAAGNFTGTFEEYQSNRNATGNYENIKDGWAAFAMEVLTGKPGEAMFYHVSVPKDYAVTGIPEEERGKPGNMDISFVELPWSRDQLDIFNDPKANLQRTLAYDILAKNLADTVKWSIYVKKGSIDLLFAREYTGVYSGEPTIEDFELLFKGKMKDAEDDEVPGLAVLDTKVAAKMMNWIRSEKLYPGARGSGVYSILQLNLYKSITTALDNEQLVAIGSKKKVGRKEEGIGHSAGEIRSGGLVGGHAYSVLATREEEAKKELELRNPWGHSVQRNIKVSDRIAEVEKMLLNESMSAEEKRELTTQLTNLKKKNPNELISTEVENFADQENGEFWMLLDDLTRRFKRIHIG